MSKKYSLLFVRFISFVITLSSTGAAALEAPASMSGGYDNKFKWRRPAEIARVAEPYAGGDMPASMQMKWNPAPVAAEEEVVAEMPRPASQVFKDSQNSVAKSSPSSMAEDSGITFGPKISTLGYGVEAGKMVNEKVGVRGNVQYANTSDSVKADGIKYDGKTDWLTAGALVDYYPVESSGFRFTGGTYLGNNSIDLSSTPTANTQVGDTTYTTGDIGTLNGKARTNMFAPYAGLGYNSFRQDFGNWNVNLDAGVKFNGKPEVELSHTGGGVSAADLATESSRIEDDMDLTQLNPVAGLTVGYKF